VNSSLPPPRGLKNVFDEKGPQGFVDAVMAHKGSKREDRAVVVVCCLLLLLLLNCCFTGVIIRFRFVLLFVVLSHPPVIHSCHVSHVSQALC
jgi:hypothetical protein